MNIKQTLKLWKSPMAIGILAVLCLLGVGGFSWRSQRSRQQQTELEALEAPPLIQDKVSALGRVEPAGGIVQVASPESGIIRDILVQPGNRLVKGQVISYLDSFETRTAERNYAQSQLTEAQETLDANLQLSEAQIQAADTRADQIDRPEEARIRAQSARIQELSAQLTLEKRDLDRFELLTARGALPRQELNTQATKVVQTEQKIVAARAELAQIAAARKADLNNAAAEVFVAKAERQVTQANTNVKSSQQNVALAEANVQRTILRSPIHGQVIEVFLQRGESTESSDNQAVLSLGNTQTMQVVAEVYETDIGLVELGQKATIRSRNGAFDGVLTGTVSDIALQIFKNDLLADDPVADVDARVIEVDIIVDQPEVIRTLTNLQVSVTIDLDTAASKDSASNT